MEVTSQDKRFPLGDFISSLRLHGFVVSPSQIAECYRIISSYATESPDADALCKYLAPILVRSQKEQEDFKVLFNRFFNPAETCSDVTQQLGAEIKKKPRLYGLLLLGLFILLLAAGAVYTAYRLLEKKPVLSPFVYNLADADATAKIARGARPFTLAHRDALRLSVQGTPSKSSIDKRYYIWGDSLKDSTGLHIYQNVQRYNLKVHVHRDATYSEVRRDTDLIATVCVCNFADTLQVRSDHPADTVSVKRKVTFYASITGKERSQLQWLVNGRPVKANDTLSVSFTNPGINIVTAKISYPGADSLCNLKKNIEVQVKNQYRQVPVNTRQQRSTITFYQTDFSRMVMDGAILLVLIALLCSLIFLFKRRNLPVNKALRLLIDSFTGNKPPLKLKFTDQSALIASDSLLDELTWKLRQREITEVFSLDVKKTIRKTAASNGLFQPVHVFRTKQVELIILIDRSDKAGLQAELFTWLAQQMRERNVFVNRFDYKEDLKICRNPLNGQSITLEQIGQNFAESILTIWGSGYQFIHDDFPTFKKDLAELIGHWKRKVLITPVIRTDWAYRETQILPAVLPVIPADTRSLLSYFFRQDNDLFEQVSGNGDRRNIHIPDLNVMSNLLRYCEVLETVPAECLLQWLASLAVYPRIDWDLLLALGKAILRNFGEERKLNFQTLLWITRIPWITEQAMSDYMRLEFLKKLSTRSEFTARETIVYLLKEIKPALLNESHFAYEEQQVELITNEFILYASDPGRYARFEASMVMFETMWRKGFVRDAVLKVYLRNTRLQWKTLILGQKKEGSNINIPLTAYFRRQQSDRYLGILRYLIAWPLLLIFTFIVLFNIYNLLVKDKDNHFKKTITILKTVDTIDKSANGKKFDLIRDTIVPAVASTFQKELSKVNHVIVICLNGHSFDNLYGQFDGANGLSQAPVARITQVDNEDRPYTFLPPIRGTNVFSPNLPNGYFNIEQYVNADQEIPDLTRSYYQEQMQINGGKMNKFALYNTSGGLSMGYYNTRNLLLYSLAKQYVLCDSFFHSAFGSAFLNYQWLIAAATPVFPNAPSNLIAKVDSTGKLKFDGSVTTEGYAVNTMFSANAPSLSRISAAILLPNQTHATIGDRLSEKQISWAWYSAGWNNALAGKPDQTFQYHHQPFVYFQNYANGSPAKKKHLKDENEFMAAARSGTLPAVSFVEPLGLSSEQTGIATIEGSEKHALELINMVMNGPNWKDALIIITYQTAGFWDHVKPPVIDSWGPGTRVPAIIISPFVKKGYVDHTQYETVSILSLIEARWGLRNLSSRDAAANPLQNVFDLRP